MSSSSSIATKGMQDTVDFTAFSKDCGVNWPEILQRPMKKNWTLHF
jgi:hypothetical protein